MRRQDLQEKDSGDGVFPEANKTRMHAFDAHLMRALGQSDERARSLAANYQMGNDQYMRQRHYLHCWTLRDEESKTMRAEHGCDGKGVCIKTTVRRLCEAVGGDRFIGHNGKQFDMKIGRGQYVEEGQPAATWPSFMIAFCKRARKDFVNEAEARLLACCYDTKCDVGPELQLVAVNFERLFSAVYLGDLVPSEHSTSLEETANRLAGSRVVRPSEIRFRT